MKRKQKQNKKNNNNNKKYITPMFPYSLHYILRSRANGLPTCLFIYYK